jgi:glutamate-1-semialdehyde aminotransferase
LEHAGQTLRDGFNAAAEEFDLPLEMRGEGAVNGVLPTSDDPAVAALLPRIGEALFARGIASNLGKVYVSLAHSDDDLAETTRAYSAALGEVKRDMAR